MQAYQSSGQMLLPVQHSSDASFDNFYGERNARAKFIVASFLDDLQEPCLAVSGAESSGKTHLLCAAITYAECKSQGTAAYFSLSELNDFPFSEEDTAALFQSLESYQVLALDELDVWLFNEPAQQKSKEVLLFSLFNFFKENHRSLILSMRNSVEACDFVLPDLVSRLKSALQVLLLPYEDAEKEAILQHVAINKGFSLGDGVSAYIIKRSGRDLKSLIALLEVLDKASLTEQRKLTIPFVKKIFDW